MLSKFVQLLSNPNVKKSLTFIEQKVVNKKKRFTGKVPLDRRHSFVPAPSGSETVRLRLLQSVAVSVGRRQRICEASCSSQRRYYSVLRESTEKMPEGKPFERLPGNVKPKHYKLNLVPDLKSFTFQGDVSIQIEVGLFYHMPVFLVGPITYMQSTVISIMQFVSHSV